MPILVLYGPSDKKTFPPQQKQAMVVDQDEDGRNFTKKFEIGILPLFQN